MGSGDLGFPAGFRKHGTKERAACRRPRWGLSPREESVPNSARLPYSLNLLNEDLTRAAAASGLAGAGTPCLEAVGERGVIRNALGVDLRQPRRFDA